MPGKSEAYSLLSGRFILQKVKAERAANLHSNRRHARGFCEDSLLLLMQTS